MDSLWDFDEWQLPERPQDPKNTEQCENTGNESDLWPITKNLQEANPCDDTNESNDSLQNKEEEQYFDLNETDDVFISYQQNYEEFPDAKIGELSKLKNYGVYTEVNKNWTKSNYWSLGMHKECNKW